MGPDDDRVDARDVEGDEQDADEQEVDLLASVEARSESRRADSNR
jgi:hypothetical protein